MPQEIAAGVAYLPIVFVNVYFVGAPGEPWVLVDSGIPGSAEKIRAAARERYGDAKPECIVLTHGHFDHAGSARELAEGWDVPIYAHHMALPYLNGALYPPRDPTVGGALAFLSRLMPSRGFDMGNRLELWPASGAPGLDDWEVLDTPGHAPGHVALFRRADGVLLAGDAIATANFDSWFGMLTKKQQLARAGTPFNYDWKATKESVEKLAALEPSVVACGHGKPMTGYADMARRVRDFAATFAPPPYGRYVQEPARVDETGIISLPPPVPDPLPAKAAVALTIAALALLARRRFNEPGA